MRRVATLLLLLCFSLLALGGSCGRNEGDDAEGEINCGGACPQQALSTANVQTIIAQSIAEAQANGVANATVAVVDRVGNVLAVFQMNAAIPADFAVPETLISSLRPDLTNPTGLENLPVPAVLAAISKAGTAAYLSSQGNAFTSRTANQILQENFNPLETGRQGGPLFGVQFSQLPCGDFVRSFADGTPSPKRMPLGLAADPGSVPLFIAGVPVGGVGVEFDGFYTIDVEITDADTQLEERVATAGSVGFAAPNDKRANRIPVDGRFLRFADDEQILLNPLFAPDFASITGGAVGDLVSVPGFADPVVRDGALLLDGASSGVAATSILSLARPEGVQAEILVEADGVTNRYPPIDSIAPPPAAGGLSAEEVAVTLQEALLVASRTRAQIRRPTGSAARVNVSVVDAAGNILGFARSQDAPLFGSDVSLQKARTAAFFSSPGAAADLSAAADPLGGPPLAQYVQDARLFLNDPTALTGAIAFSDRAGGNLSRPFFPDGQNGKANGPFSRPIDSWSVFSTGLQLDASLNGFAVAVCPLVPAIQALLGGVCPAPPPAPSCTDPGIAAANGFQIFPGSVPIYAGPTFGVGNLIGGIGISGDGVDQDDLVAFLGLDNASVRLARRFGNATPGIRADTIEVQSVQLRYVNCPASPFNDSSEQRVCEGK
jgi:uncharacterized protein GlcG (DUF336 family)